MDFTKLLMIGAGLFVVYMLVQNMNEDAVANEGVVQMTPGQMTPGQMTVGGAPQCVGDDPFATPIPGNPADFTGAAVDKVNWDGLGESQIAGALSKQYQELDASDLLPHSDIAQWADVYPGGIGNVESQNFLSSGFHVGINSVGQSLKNPNLQLRSEPPNPQSPVSPWLQSSFGPRYTSIYQQIVGWVKKYFSK